MESLMRRLLLLIVAVASLGAGPAVLAEDWYQWRGPENNGVSREKNLPDKWSPKTVGENNLIWKQPYGGRTVPIVMNGRVYVINDSGEGINEQERVMCFDADTGKVIWQHKFNVWLTGIVSDRVGWGNVVGDPETGNVYAHGVQGLLFCFDGKTGQIKWQHSMTEEYGRITGYGGRVTTPIIDEDRLILGMVNSSWGEYARGSTRFVALDKKTGKILWWSETGHQVKNTYYSNPVVAVVNGERIMVSGGGDGGVHAFQARTGEKLWSYLFGTGDINVTPVVDGNYIYIGHGGENLSGGERGMLLCLDGSKVKDGKPALVWKVSGIQFTFPSPILLDGKLYIADEAATLYCYDAKKGTELWHKGYGIQAKGSPVWADGKIYATSVQGNVVILKPGDTGCDVLSRVILRSKTPGTALSINGGPSVANGRVYFMTSEEMYCIGKPDAKPEAEPHPARPQGRAAGQGRQGRSAPGGAGRRGIVPRAERHVHGSPVRRPGPLPARDQGRVGRRLRSWLRRRSRRQAAGGSAAAHPARYDHGRRQAHRQRQGAGPVRRRGGQGRGPERPQPHSRRTASALFAGFLQGPSGPHAGRLGRSPGQVPRQGPGRQEGAGQEQHHRQLAGRQGQHLYHPARHRLRRFTIQADVRGSLKNGQYLPDMGLINCRYTLILSGSGQKDGVGQKLSLQSWDAMPRIDRTVDFPWKPETWYTMKLSVEQSGGKAQLQGKVWERGQPEPGAWTVTFEDPTPNGPGSAGLHGYSTDVNGPTRIPARRFTTIT